MSINIEYHAGQESWEVNNKFGSWQQAKNGFNHFVLYPPGDPTQNAELTDPFISQIVGDNLVGRIVKKPSLYNDLAAAGLTTPVPLQTRFVELDRHRTSFPIKVNMEGDETQYARGSRSLTSVPVLVLSTGTNRNFRDYDFQAMDDEMIAMEDLMRERDRVLLRGVSGTYTDGRNQEHSLKGLSNADNVNLVSWDHQASDLYTEIQKLVAPLRNKDIDAPVLIYFAHSFMEELEKDYKAEVGRSLLDRLLDNPSTSQIKPLYGLADHEALVVPLSRRFVDVPTSIGYTMLPVPAQNEGTSVSFKHLMTVSLRVKAYDDLDGGLGTGVVFGT